MKRSIFTPTKNPWKRKPTVARPGYKLSPPDGGWGYIIILSNCLNFIAFMPLITNFAILFSAHLNHLGSNKTQYAIIANLNFCTWSLQALLMGPLCDIYGYKKTTLIGSLLTFASCIMCGFSNSLILFGIGYGVIAGIAGAFTLFPGNIIIPRYFDKRKGLAFGITTSALAVCKIFLPVMTEFLLETYGYKWTCLIIAVWSLNSIPVALTLHPPHWHQIEIPIENKDDIVSSEELKQIKETNQNETENDCLELKQLEEEPKQFEKPFINKLKKEEKLSNSVFELSASIQDIPPVDIQDSHQSKNDSKSFWDKFIIFKVIRMLDYKLLLNPYTYMTSIPYSISLLIYVNFLYMVPEFLKSCGITSYKSAIALSIIAVGELGGRFCFSFMSDYKWFPMRWVYIISFAIKSICLLVLPLYQTYVWVILVCTIYGIGRGCVSSLQAHLNLEYIDRTHYAQLVGFNSLSNFIFQMVGGPLIGIIRSRSSDEQTAIQFLGIFSCVGATIWLFEPLFRKFRTRSSNQA